MINIYQNNQRIGRVYESKDLAKRFLIIFLIFSVFATILHYYPQEEQTKLVIAKTEGTNTPKTQENATQGNTEPNSHAQNIPETKSSVELPIPEPVDLFVKYFGDKADTIKAICTAESGLTANAISKPNRNGTLDYGLCQVNSIHLWRVGGDYTRLLDAETNIRIARDIYNDRLKWDSDGFKAWTTYNHKKHLKYLK
jgi:soluble lytic murein transglycosylase-like protein